MQRKILEHIAKTAGYEFEFTDDGSLLMYLPNNSTGMVQPIFVDCNLGNNLGFIKIYTFFNKKFDESNYSEVLRQCNFQANAWFSQGTIIAYKSQGLVEMKYILPIYCVANTNIDYIIKPAIISIEKVARIYFGISSQFDNILTRKDV